jgi:hypothetical protein
MLGPGDPAATTSAAAKINNVAESFMTTPHSEPSARPQDNYEVRATWFVLGPEKTKSLPNRGSASSNLSSGFVARKLDESGATKPSGRLPFWTGREGNIIPLRNGGLNHADVLQLLETA